MSSLIVEVCTIEEVTACPNADRLDLVRIKGWSCVVQKNSYKVGDKAIYIPIDAQLTQEVEDKIFGLDSKVKLHNHRVKTIKLRGNISQGLVVSPALFGFEDVKVGEDVAERLGVLKYEPPEAHMPQIQGMPRRQHPDFHKYTDVENLKNYPDVLIEGEECVITEKLHGSNARFGVVTAEIPSSIWSLRHWVLTMKKWAGLSLNEFHVGSHNVDLYEDANNLYWKMAAKWELDKILPHGHVLFGEIYGKGIQKMTYGLEDVDIRFFDLMIDGTYVSYSNFTLFCASNHFPVVPELYCGPWSKDLVTMADGKSTIADHIREGFVVKPVVERWDHAVGRVALKCISASYLLSKDSEEVIAH